MLKETIYLANPEKAEEFVNDIKNLQSNFDINNGSRCVDAKSLLGIMSVNLEQPLEVVCIVADGEQDIVNGILKKYKNI